jgi:hypothetical protein
MPDTKQEESPETEKKLTPEEIEAYKAEMTKFYDDQMPFLIKQRDYEVCLADIEEAKARRLTMIMRQVQMTTPPPPTKEPVKP